MNTSTSYIHVDQRSISSSVNVKVFKANVPLHLKCNSAYINKSVFCNNVDNQHLLSKRPSFHELNKLQKLLYR